VRIALLSFEYPPETGFGGIGTYTWYQARALARLGHDVHVLAGANEATSLRTSEHDGVHVHRFRAGGVPMRAVAMLGRRGLWWTRNRLENAWSMHRGLRALRRRHRFDVIEMPECGAEGLFVNRTAREPTVVRFHSPAQLIMPYYDVRPRDVAWCSRLERRGIRTALSLTSCSRFLAGAVRPALDETRPITVIPNGIDLRLFDATDALDARSALGLPRDRPIILFAGRMEPRKGIDLLPHIAASILARHEVALVLAGDDLFGHVANTVQPAVARVGLRGSLHHVGKLDSVMLRSLLRQSDLFLMPSLWENCPYSCLEAMAAGRAIVSSDQGGMPELLRHGDDALLAVSGNAATFVEQLDRLILDPDLRAHLGGAARRTVEARLTDTQMARASIEHYQALLEAPARSRQGAPGG
jgi:glycosyltransferase involved in cell wall biosynthesis